MPSSLAPCCSYSSLLTLLPPDLCTYWCRFPDCYPQVLSWLAPSHLSGLSSERPSLRALSEVCPSVSHDQGISHSLKAAFSRVLSAPLQTELRSKTESIFTLPKHYRATVPCVMQKGHRYTQFSTLKACSLSLEGSKYFRPHIILVCSFCFPGSPELTQN